MMDEMIRAERVTGREATALLQVNEGARASPVRCYAAPCSPGRHSFLTSISGAAKSRR